MQPTFRSIFLQVASILYQDQPLCIDVPYPKSRHNTSFLFTDVFGTVMQVASIRPYQHQMFHTGKKRLERI